MHFYGNKYKFVLQITTKITFLLSFMGLFSMKNTSDFLTQFNGPSDNNVTLHWFSTIKSITCMSDARIWRQSPPYNLNVCA